MAAVALLTHENSVDEKPAQERAILQYVVDNIPYLIFWKNRDSVYLGCNKNFAAVDNLADPSELIGKTDYDTAWKAHADQYRAGDLATMAGGEAILNKEERSPDGKGGEMVILTSKVPLRNDAGEVTGLLGIIVDITERKQIEVDLQRAKEAAEHAALAKSHFIANVSHELRTPLTLILGPVSDALRDPSLADSTRTLLECVHRNGLRLYGLVNDVLDSARGEAGRTAVRRERLDAVATIRALIDDMQPLAESRRLSLTFATTADHLHGALDPKLLERVLLNLIGNALKFTPAGGSVRVNLASGENPDELRIAVSDDGIGITKEDQLRLFRPFTQIDSGTARKHEGTGLGLTLVKQFVEVMGGSVKLESDGEGLGSTFTVVLPIVEGEISAAESESASPDEPAVHAPFAAPAPVTVWDDTTSVGKPRVLVADDNPDIRSYIAQSLQGEFAVVAVDNGMQAWEKLHAHRFDVIVSDVMMPQLDGFALTARIKADAALRHLPVILLTARGGTEATASGLGAGADDYIAKPFAVDELRARVRAAVRMSRLNEELRLRSRKAGMADVAAGILHNLGNVLNGVTVSSALIEEEIRRSHVRGVQQLAELLTKHSSDMPSFLAKDGRGGRLPEYVNRLASQLTEEHDLLSRESARLQQKLEHVKGIVAVHRDVAMAVGVDDLFAVDETTELALRLCASSQEPPITIVRRLEQTPLVHGDQHKALQILVNLINNARYSLSASAREDKVLSITTERWNDGVRVVVSDNGGGIAPDVKEKLFTQGFTTKEDGQGLGLHNSAGLAEELGGSLSATSDGVDHGATFVLALPLPALDRSHSPDMGQA